ncbi:hypothetical protein [Streptomyces sp. CC210A]|uniref:hypothetical protein n=1 Tax=Streptomyces sp. CC210A TaxID=2898184 RepID=UPI001F220ECC|nr:hypothetical protein [Streptomyces sp. CC210A]
MTTDFGVLDTAATAWDKVADALPRVHQDTDAAAWKASTARVEVTSTGSTP